MEELAKIGGFVLSGIIELVIERAIKMPQDQWLCSRPELWCSLQRKLSMMKGMVSHAKKRAYFDHDPGVKALVEGLQVLMCDTNNVLDDLEYKKLKEKVKQQNKLRGYFLKYKPFSLFEHAVILKISDIEKKLDGLLQQANSYTLEVIVDNLNSNMYANSQGRMTTSFLDNEVFGRDIIRDHIIQFLTDENSMSKDAHILSIVGMGGIGKTTLAQMVYNHQKVKSCFKLKIWVCVSDDFDEQKLIRRILESIYYSKRKQSEKGENMKIDNLSVSLGNSMDLEVLKKELVDELEGKLFFLVLDDVWNENPTKWQNIANILKTDDEKRGSKVLVTTRSKITASITSSSKPIHLDGLSDDVLWPLFKTYIFGTANVHFPDLEDIAMKIMGKLKGSPLAAKTVGRILASNRNKIYWQNILNSEIWTWPQYENEITSALMLSYNYLPEHLKICFAFCSLYPKDFIYEKKQIIYMWIAMGYIQNQRRGLLLEEIGEEYVNELLDRSMFQCCTDNDISFRYSSKIIYYEANEVFKIHDLVHDLAKMVSANESLMIQDEYALKSLSSSTINLSLFVDDRNWKWNGQNCFGYLNNIHDVKNIRTLILLTKNKIVRRCSYEIPREFYVFLKQIVAKMKYLRVLDLSWLSIEELPLPKLKHLRYLNLLGTKVKMLPSSLEYAYQLQVLNCENIQIPQQIKDMTSLRHIRGFHVNMDAIPNLENFHFLQELEYDVSKKHKLKGLRCMKEMRELYIYGLGDVKSREDALEAELKSMDQLTKLTLRWDSTPLGGNLEEDILECLHPGPNVTNLKIENYPGEGCVSWIGNLSLLQELYLRECRNIKLISIQSESKGFEALSSLEQLDIENCPQLIVDLFAEGCGGLPSSLKVINLRDEGGTIINVSSIILQSITNLSQLRVWSNSGGSITPSPRNPPERQQLQQLRKFALDCTSTQQLKEWLLHLQGCKSLVEIRFESAGCSLEVFDTEMEEALVSFVSLRELWLLNFFNCRSLPTRLCEISSLKELRLWHSPKINSLPERGLPADLQVLRIGPKGDCPLLKKHLKRTRHELPCQLHVRFE